MALSSLLLCWLLAGVVPAFGQETVIDRAAERFVRFQMLVGGLNQFDAFTDGGGELVAQLYQSRLFATTDLAVGHGVTYRIRNRVTEELDERVVLTVALLVREADGTETWGYEMERERGSFYLEAMYNDYGIPLELRYIDRIVPGADGARKRVPEFAGDFEDIAEEEGIESVTAQLEQVASQMIAEAVSTLFANPEVVGRESLSVGAGRFNARHIGSVHDYGSIDYWYDESAPGAIIRYELVSSDESVNLTGELIDVRTGYTERLQNAELVARPENGASQDDFPDDIDAPASAPRILDWTYYVEAGLAANEADHFGIEIPADSVVTLHAVTIEGEIEIASFGSDGEFQAPVATARGEESRLEIEDVPEGEVVYFTVTALDGPAAYYFTFTEPVERAGE